MELSSLFHLNGIRCSFVQNVLEGIESQQYKGSHPRKSLGKFARSCESKFPKFSVFQELCAPEKVWNWFYAFSETFSGDLLFFKSRRVPKLNSFAVIKHWNILFRENNWFLVINISNSVIFFCLNNYEKSSKFTFV